MHQDIYQAVAAVLPYRHAAEVTANIEQSIASCTCYLRGKRVPAYFATDLGVPAKQLDRLEAVLRTHGAALAR